MKQPPKPRTAQRQTEDHAASPREQRSGTQSPPTSGGVARSKVSGREKKGAAVVSPADGGRRENPRPDSKITRAAQASEPASSGEKTVKDEAVVRKRISSTVSQGSQPAPLERKFELAPTANSGKSLADLSRFTLPKVPVLSTGMADRIAERQAIAKHDRNKRRLVWLGVVVAIAGAVYLFGFSRLFAVDLSQTKVDGAETYVTREEVLEALKRHESAPLTRLDLGEVNSDLLAIKNVKSATQTRNWPQGISVSIVERVPVAAVPSGKEFTLLDLDAVEVTSVKKAPEGLPIIKIPMTGENKRTLNTALAILDAIPASLLTEIGSITAQTQDDIEFKLRDGVNVQWGNSADTDLKYEVLERLRPIALKDGKKTIDLSAPTFPIIRK